MLTSVLAAVGAFVLSEVYEFEIPVADDGVISGASRIRPVDQARVISVGQKLWNDSSAVFNYLPPQLNFTFAVKTHHTFRKGDFLYFTCSPFSTWESMYPYPMSCSLGIFQLALPACTCPINDFDLLGDFEKMYESRSTHCTPTFELDGVTYQMKGIETGLAVNSRKYLEFAEDTDYVIVWGHYRYSCELFTNEDLCANFEAQNSRCKWDDATNTCVDDLCAPPPPAPLPATPPPAPKVPAAPSPKVSAAPSPKVSAAPRPVGPFVPLPPATCQDCPFTDPVPPADW